MVDKNQRTLIAHLLRRAGFGATSAELDRYETLGYAKTVEELVNPVEAKWMGDALARRFHHEQSGMMGPRGNGDNWLYRMITTKTPLAEKITLFWHGIFATGYPKVIHGKMLSDQIRMFRKFGLGNFKDLLTNLAKDPAMIVWLDNFDNHKTAINENFGRELLELFSMGVGSYSEDDIKECSRAFTGWTLGNTEYMVLRSNRDSDWPYGRISWHFEFDSEDHDSGEKEFLGKKGNFDGFDIINIICEQESTARFIARHIYHFFVADEPPVPSWPYTPPRDPEAIEFLSSVYFDSNYDIRKMLTALFNSDFFKSQEIRYSKVKSPAEFVAGTLRLTNEFDRPRYEIKERALQMSYMGQHLNNPPSVEGWNEGTGWIDTGTLVERINFASEQLGDITKPGVKSMLSDISSNLSNSDSSKTMVELCCKQLGELELSDKSKNVLIEYADKTENSIDGLAGLLRVSAATEEFQRS